MKLKDRIKDCNDRAKAFFDHIHEFFVKAFHDAQDFINSHVLPVLHFVEGLKAAIDNPAVDFLTSIIPGEVDNLIVARLREYLGEAIALLQIKLECTDGSLEQQITCFIEHLRSLSPEMRNAILHRTATILSKLSAAAGQPHNFTDTEIDTMVQVEYNRLKTSLEQPA